MIFNHWLVITKKEKDLPTKVGLLYIDREIELPVVTFKGINKPFKEIAKEAQIIVGSEVEILKDRQWFFETSQVKDVYYPATLIDKAEVGNLLFIPMEDFLNSYVGKQMEPGVLNHLQKYIK